MLEIVWHGRGGQGAFTAAKLLGAAAAGHEGLHALAFPSFGPERRGAPMRAFTKIDAKPVADRSVPAHADIVVYLDETLLDGGWRGECRKAPAGGADVGTLATGATGAAAPATATTVLVNHAQAGRTAEGLLCLPASAIAARVLGRDIPNTAFLGAICELSEALDVSDALRAIDELMPPRLREANKEAVRVAARAMREMMDDTTPDSVELALIADCSSADAADGANAQAQEGYAPIAHLRHDALDYTAIAQTTCFSSGYLDHGNAGWRSMRPVVDADACVGCRHCWMQCPDACIIRKDDGLHAGLDATPSQPATLDPDTAPAPPAAPEPALGKRPGRHTVKIDYALCKGCGICARACPVHAIEMAPEHEGGVAA